MDYTMNWIPLFIHWDIVPGMWWLAWSALIINPERITQKAAIEEALKLNMDKKAEQWKNNKTYWGRLKTKTNTRFRKRMY